MADPYADKPASRSVLLEIKRDRQVIQEGYGFLDEKRVLIAQELLRRLDAYRRADAEIDRLQRAAAARLAEALEVHGLEGLQVYPPWHWDDAGLEMREQSFLGVRLVEDSRFGLAAPEEGARLRLSPARPSREAESCAEAFHRLVEAAAAQAVALGNLQRLAEEYTRTDRRARALEDVILPEVKGAETRMQDHLDEAEQEEAVRIRLFAR